MKACTQCGRCCTNAHFMGTLHATHEDVKRWRREHRWEILQYCGEPFFKGSNVDLWIHPVHGYDLDRCPFVRKLPKQDKYKCMIYETRPEVCRNYPLFVGHMKTVDCEMLEEGDTDADVERFMKAENEK